MRGVRWKLGIPWFGELALCIQSLLLWKENDGGVKSGV